MPKRKPHIRNEDNQGSGPKTDEQGYSYISRRPLLDLFPQITPYSSGFLTVDELHNLYWEQSGNPDGMPILLLHGGPGAGATPTHRRFFDPDFFRIVIFDQRGAGRSHPLGCIQNNTSQDLVEDIERLRKHLNIKRWHLFGGSWGSTLAIDYASQFRERCISLILRGIFMCEPDEINWFLYGMKNVFPEAWEQFAGLLPEEEQRDLLEGYYRRLTNEYSEAEQMEAAIRWSLYEGACSSLLPNYETITTEEQKMHALALARIEAHYFRNEARPPEKSLLKAIDHLRSVPTAIIQGRYDIICPIQTAYKVHQLWPEADYVVVPDAGHSALDAPLRSRLIEATEAIKNLK
ncbi:MAG: prolyl aminopeptidase [Rhodospirillales bacterium]|nr:prolyl aminopeptidase [Alphaproteobacteria bacterium]MCB1840095.1 prolyl aminopeptidase [Alphaproteobacteria bacterium]MCB9976680.1 prolyl aminopeptidase [Rhodospirillales bacterium]